MVLSEISTSVHLGAEECVHHSFKPAAVGQQMKRHRNLQSVLLGLAFIFPVKSCRKFPTLLSWLVLLVIVKHFPQAVSLAASMAEADAGTGECSRHRQSRGLAESGDRLLPRTGSPWCLSDSPGMAQGTLYQHK